MHFLDQRYTSAATSRPKVPALFNRVGKQLGPVNADVGGGKYDLGTKHLAKFKVKNILWDPFNRSDAHNEAALSNIEGKQADTATCSDVLNVIMEDWARRDVIEFCESCVKPGGKCYFSIYKAPKKGETRCGWQEGRSLASYLPEVRSVFPTAKIVSDYIVAEVALSNVVCER